MTHKFALSFILIISLKYSTLSAQQIQVKKNCFANSKCQIVLKYEHGDTSISADRAGCELYSFTKLPQNYIIKAIKLLLLFSDDSSLSANKVGLYNNRYPMQERPKSKDCPLRVEALFFITYLGLSENGLWYSPFPVLYNTETKQEITSASEIDDIFRLYTQWYSFVEKNGFVNYPCPLNQTKYAWFGSLHPKKTIESYPNWDVKGACPVAIPSTLKGN